VQIVHGNGAIPRDPPEHHTNIPSLPQQNSKKYFILSYRVIAIVPDFEKRSYVVKYLKDIEVCLKFLQNESLLG
jgi:hypothetical protein